MCKRLLVLALVLGLMSSLCNGVSDTGTGRIMIISDGGYMDRDDNIVIPNPEGKIKYNDSPLVWFLEDLGYCVDTRGMAETYWRVEKNPHFPDNPWWAGLDWRKQALLDADLIIMTRYASSSSYCDRTMDGVFYNDRPHWAALPVPIIAQNSPLLRGDGDGVCTQKKWGWTDGCVIKPGPALTKINGPGPWTWTAFDYSGFLGGVIPNANHNVQPLTGNWPAGSTVLSTYGGGLPPYPAIVHIPAGADFDALNNYSQGAGYYGVAGAERMFFEHWGYDGSNWPGTPGYAWNDPALLTLTPAGLSLFAMAVAYMIPEPATIALLGLGGLALLRRRR